MKYAADRWRILARWNKATIANRHTSAWSRIHAGCEPHMCDEWGVYIIYGSHDSLTALNLRESCMSAADRQSGRLALWGRYFEREIQSARSSALQWWLKKHEYDRGRAKISFYTSTNGGNKMISVTVCDEAGNMKAPYDYGYANMQTALYEEERFASMLSISCLRMMTEGCMLYTGFFLRKSPSARQMDSADRRRTCADID